MNLQRLKQAEAAFFYQYPGGFENPELIRSRKKHNLPKMFALTQESFVKRNFLFPDLIVDNMAKVIGRSSLLSVFEKPRFRNFAYALPPGDRQALAKGLEELLHGNEQAGFELMLEILMGAKLAKWSLLTICRAYHHPSSGVFVKPTTTKRIIEYFELDHLHYEPTPTWGFYSEYRTALNDMKSRVDASLSPYNIAFTGFLMRSMPGSFL